MAVSPHSPVKELSHNLLGMKFMKKSKENTEKKKEKREFKSMYGSQLKGEIDTPDRYVKEDSYIPCMDLLVGRFSFLGMNPEIENIMEEEEAEASGKTIIRQPISYLTVDSEFDEEYPPCMRSQAFRFQICVPAEVREEMLSPVQTNSRSEFNKSKHGSLNRFKDSSHSTIPPLPYGGFDACSRSTRSRCSSATESSASTDSDTGDNSSN